MNQENAPHMQPMEQVGAQQEMPPQQENANGEALPHTQPVQQPAPFYGYGAGQAMPYPLQESAMAAQQAMPQAVPYPYYSQPGYPMQPGSYPTMMQPNYQASMPGTSTMQPVPQGSELPSAPAAEQQWPTTAAQQPMPQQATFTANVYPQFTPQNTQVQQPGAQMQQSMPTQPAPPMPAPFVPSFVEEASYDESYAHTMNGGIVEAEQGQPEAPSFDYHYINSPARIAIYDSLKTAPRVIQVQGGPTHEYIEHIASLTYKNAKEAGGMIPYTVIREVSENFIHAKFNEVVVSIFDQGNTIRFADQGPGIKHKDLVQEPGFSSAIEPMKRYIRGVGSGLPIVKDYLSTSHGHIEIKDNVNQGSVVTISLVASRTSDEEIEALQVPDLTENEAAVLKALLPNKTLGVSEVSKETGIAVASVHTAFSKMEEAGLVEKVNKKRTLTAHGTQVALSL